MTPVLLGLRRAWRRLISMRTALVLLFLLAVASVPGSLLPQRPLNPSKVDAYLRDHGTWGRFLDRLGFFDVFGSAWFSAVYLLLFVSLVGCLVPRIRVHVRSSLARPLPAPKQLLKLPESARFEATAAPADLAPAVRRAVGRRWRTTVREEPGGAVTLSAEKGYSRETGNIVFHVSLLVALVLVAVGRIYHYEGSTIVTAGDSFCSSSTAFDSWRPGRVAAGGGIAPAPVCVRVNSFTARYLDTGEPTSFAAGITYYDQHADGTAGPSRTDLLQVNHPLRLQGDRLYLISHGFTPVVTVTTPAGRTYDRVADPFIPSDTATLLSEGAFKFAQKAGTGSDIGIQGIFAPDPVETSPNVYSSASPQVKDPVLGIFVWKGDLGLATGEAQSVYSVDTSRMTKLGGANLRQGQSRTFSDGTVVRFDGYREWVALQVSHDPTQGWLLVAAVSMVAGLIGSLAVRRRRLWVRVRPVTDGSGAPTLVTVGGLARNDSGNFAEEFAATVARIRAAVAGTDPPPAERTDQLTTAGRH